MFFIFHKIFAKIRRKTFTLESLFNNVRGHFFSTKIRCSCFTNHEKILRMSFSTEHIRGTASTLVLERYGFCTDNALFYSMYCKQPLKLFGKMPALQINRKFLKNVLEGIHFLILLNLLPKTILPKADSSSIIY